MRQSILWVGEVIVSMVVVVRMATPAMTAGCRYELARVSWLSDWPSGGLASDDGYGGND